MDGMTFSFPFLKSSYRDTESTVVVRPWQTDSVRPEYSPLQSLERKKGVVL
jgi:hypothetical protein